MRLVKDMALIVVGLVAFAVGAGLMVLVPEVGLLTLFTLIGFAVHSHRGGPWFPDNRDLPELASQYDPE
jgi:hypothetical protein